MHPRSKWLHKSHLQFLHQCSVPFWVLHVAFVITSLVPSNSQASTGVSDERVVLPDGPGSIGGIGENVDIDPNMGLMNYPVNIVIPDGLSGLTPEVSLSYNSGGGSSVLGVGWSFPSPSIERMSLRGLPEYDLDDEMAVNGGDELIYVTTHNSQRVYRTRFEREFVRYKWHEAGDGEAGYWTGEYPNGTTAYYGANASGTIVDSARVTNASGQVFRYLLVEKTDPFGHRLSYQYSAKTLVDGDPDFAAYSAGNLAFEPLLTRINYVYNGGDARFSVRFEYSADGVRQDVISDCIPGYDLRLDKRLTTIRIFSSANEIRRYQMSYEDYATSGGFTRLSGIDEYGRNDTHHPIHFSFGYSKSLGGIAGPGDEEPFMVDMGMLPGGVDMTTGVATLFDINGDALPDVLHTDAASNSHYFYMNQLNAMGNPEFSTTVVTSTTSAGSFILDGAGVQVLDVNGDGFTDLIESKNGGVLCNYGLGDWASDTLCLGNSTLPTLSADSDDPDEGDTNPLHVRFLDYDNDKRIDMIRTPNANTAEVYRNTGTDYAQVMIDAIGAAFDEDEDLQLADINGDSLQDVVDIQSGGVIRYRLNLGWGRWSTASSTNPWTEITLPGLNTTDLDAVELEDINGDGLADVVMAMGTELKYALNRNGAQFDDVITVTSAEVDGDLPETTSETMVLFADMNGNGSDDVVWIKSGQPVQFLELFPIKPNLLNRIENGIGHVQYIEYGTSVAEQARDKSISPWKYRLPHAMNIVTASDQWVTLSGGDGDTGLHERLEYEYHDGYYDGVEKSFRGFAAVEIAQLADTNLDSQDPSLTALTFDVGDSDPYFNGLQLSSQLYSGSGSDLTPLEKEIHEWEDCPLTGIDNGSLVRPVKFVCETATTRIAQEGVEESEWATKKVEMEYDGFGNVSKSSNFGVINMGSVETPSGCEVCTETGVFGAPCGPDCLGDEDFKETDYIEPGADTSDAWFTSKPSRSIDYGVAGGAQTETLYYYDGDDYVGLELGKLEKGLETRTTRRINAGSNEVVATERYAFDSHGNVTGSLDENGSPSDTSGHRRTYTYDALGLKIIRIEIALTDAGGDSYQLRREITYDPTFYQPNAATAWMTIRDGSPVTSRNESKFRYDDHGRIIKMIKPGDSDTSPTQEYSYELGDPASRIVIRSRSAVGGPQDLEEVRCLDGRGREFQKRTKLGDNLYQVTGFTELNSRGAEIRVFQPYQGTSGECETTAPSSDVAFMSYRYDAIHRLVEVTQPDGDLYPSASIETMTYTPLAEYSFDVLDNDPTSFAYNTPFVKRKNGLGRTFAIERYLEDIDSGGTPATVTLQYDGLGNLAAYIDPAGNKKTQSFDLLGRVTQVDDPNAGVVSFTYDAAGNQLTRTDARGVVLVAEYDGVNRTLSRWDDADKEGTATTYEYDYSSKCATCKNTAAQLVRATYPLGGERGNGIDTYGFNARNNPISVNRSLEGVDFGMAYDYDNADRLTSITYPDNTTVTNTYDVASRVVAISGAISSVSFDERSLMNELTYANAAKTNYNFDDLMRVTGISHTAGGSALQAFGYTRDRVGNIVDLSDNSDEREGTPAWDATFTYDAWYRVIGAGFDFNGDSAETITIVYDEIDNILSCTSDLGTASAGHVGDYTYSEEKPNAVSAAGPLSYDYNEAGMASTRDGVGMEWDYQGRLTKVTQGSTLTGEFVYGLAEERVMKIEPGGVVHYLDTDFQLRDGISTRFVRVDNQRIARFENDTLATSMLSDLDDDDIITAADAWLAYAGTEGIIDPAGSDPSDPERLLNSSALRMMLDENGESTFFFQHDHLGSITLATDTDGNVVGEQAYHVNGETRFATGYIGEYGFTGQERDESTDLMHFQHRYFDTFAGRWMSADPKFISVDADALDAVADAVSSYAYVSNNFINLTDPTGLCPDCAGQTDTQETPESTEDTPAADTPEDATVSDADAADAEDDSNPAADEDTPAADEDTPAADDSTPEDAPAEDSAAEDPAAADSETSPETAAADAGGGGKGGLKAEDWVELGAAVTQGIMAIVAAAVGGDTQAGKALTVASAQVGTVGKLIAAKIKSSRGTDNSNKTTVPANSTPPPKPNTAE